jgi:hypothetical protein
MHPSQDPGEAAAADAVEQLKGSEVLAAVAGGGDAGERPPGGGSHVTESLELDAALPFDVGAHPQAPSAPAWLMTARLARDVRINAGRSNGARVPRVAFLLDMDLDRVCAEGGGGAARATAAREAYRVLISVREELKASDQAFMARAHANQVPPGDCQASAVRPAGTEAAASPVPDRGAGASGTRAAAACRDRSRANARVQVRRAARELRVLSQYARRRRGRNVLLPS